MDIDDLIYPRTRFQALRALFYADTPITLSEIADRAEIMVSSVQTALDWLLKERIISKQQLNNRTYFRFSNKAAKEMVAKLLEVLEPLKLQAKAKLYKDRGKDLFDNIEDSYEMVRKGRKSLKR